MVYDTEGNLTLDGFVDVDIVEQAPRFFCFFRSLPDRFLFAPSFKKSTTAKQSLQKYFRTAIMTLNVNP